MKESQHTLVKYEYQTNSLEQYRHYCSCSCGFETRMSTQAAAESQFNAHLLMHGQEIHFKDVDKATEDMKKPTPNKGWTPSFKK